MADIRNSKKIRERAAELRQRCAARGVVLVAGEAEEILLSRVRDIARQLGVTERTALDRYFDDSTLAALVEAVGEAGAQYADAVVHAESLLIGTADLGRAVAALGMTIKLATQAMESKGTRADALGVSTDCADAFVGIGVALNDAGSREQVQVDGRTLVYARKVLQRCIELVHEGSWECPRQGRRHEPGQTCEFQDQLAVDLGILGGWLGGSTEPPAAAR